MFVPALALVGAHWLTRILADGIAPRYLWLKWLTGIAQALMAVACAATALYYIGETCSGARCGTTPHMVWLAATLIALNGAMAPALVYAWVAHCRDARMGEASAPSESPAWGSRSLDGGGPRGNGNDLADGARGPPRLEPYQPPRTQRLPLASPLSAGPSQQPRAPRIGGAPRPSPPKGVPAHTAGGGWANKRPPVSSAAGDLDSNEFPGARAATAPADDDDDDNGGRSCPVCLEAAQRNTALVPCGHVLCARCAQFFAPPQRHVARGGGGLKPCPICRAPVASTLRTFM